jgi:fatty acid desaturase
MFETVSFYRSSHIKHHSHLGMVGLDPDGETHLKYGYSDQNPPSMSSSKQYFDLVFNASAWKDSIFGSFLKLPNKTKTQVALWWMIVLGGIGFYFGLTFPISVFAMWMMSRTIGYHGIRMFAEFLDHSGLKAGSIIGFSRTIPGGSKILAFLFHPHCDNFHLAHHLAPNIPHYNLRAAHNIFQNIQSYNRAHHCDGYFIGKHTAISCWTSNCTMGAL